jgi:hypothetical protein
MTTRKKASKPAHPAVGSCAIELPLVRLPADYDEQRDGYLRRHVEVRLDDRQALVMKALLEGCDHGNCRLAKGTRVLSTADVFRYILEQITVNGK